jgi:hypothetical protein
MTFSAVKCDHRPELGKWEDCRPPPENEFIWLIYVSAYKIVEEAKYRMIAKLSQYQSVVSGLYLVDLNGV